MKLLLTGLLALACALPAIADVVVLDREHINLGRLTQAERSPGELTVQVKRTQNTPEEVQVKVTYDSEVRECARWVQERHYIPGFCRTVWNGRHYQRICYPGRYELRTFCAGYRDVVRSNSRDIELDFEKAATLADGRTEEYEITFTQESYHSDDLDLSARVLASDVAYEIKNRGDELVFKAQD